MTRIEVEQFLNNRFIKKMRTAYAIAGISVIPLIMSIVALVNDKPITTVITAMATLILIYLSTLPQREAERCLIILMQDEAIESLTEFINDNMNKK